MRTTSITIKNTTGFPFTLKGSNSHEYPVVYCSDVWDVASNNKMSLMFGTGQYSQNEINENLITLLSLVFDVVELENQVIDDVVLENKFVVPSPYSSFSEFDAFSINGTIYLTSEATYDQSKQITSIGYLAWSDMTPGIASSSSIIPGTKIIAFKKK